MQFRSCQNPQFRTLHSGSKQYKTNFLQVVQKDPKDLHPLAAYLTSSPATLPIYLSLVTLVS